MVDWHGDKRAGQMSNTMLHKNDTPEMQKFHYTNKNEYFYQPFFPPYHENIGCESDLSLKWTKFVTWLLVAILAFMESVKLAASVFNSFSTAAFF